MAIWVFLIFEVRDFLSERGGAKLIVVGMLACNSVKEDQGGVIERGK